MHLAKLGLMTRSQAIIIGHSMGNLVARYFLERMGGTDVSLMHVAVAPPFKV